MASSAKLPESGALVLKQLQLINNNCKIESFYERIGMIACRFATFVLCLCSALVTPAAMAQHTYRLEFQGTQYGKPGNFNGGTNELSIHHGDIVDGAFEFELDKSLESLFANPVSVQYTNPVMLYNFMTENSQLGLPSYSSVTVHTGYSVEYGLLQIYVSSVHDGVSDVFSANVSSSLNSANIRDWSSGLSMHKDGLNDWMFQRYNFETGALVQYRGGISSFNIAQAPSLVPEAETYAMLISGLFLMMLVRKLTR